MAYVYIHERLDSGVPFYVGKGSGKYKYPPKDGYFVKPIGSK